jgi:hypothetical protein
MCRLDPKKRLQNRQNKSLGPQGKNRITGRTKRNFVKIKMWSFSECFVYNDFFISISAAAFSDLLTQAPRTFEPFYWQRRKMSDLGCLGLWDMVIQGRPKNFSTRWIKIPLGPPKAKIWVTGEGPSEIFSPTMYSAFWYYLTKKFAASENSAKYAKKILNVGNLIL